MFLRERDFFQRGDFVASSPLGRREIILHIK
jgi:hypothetical protein